jgi:alpha-N-arabinofuranosidase
MPCLERATSFQQNLLQHLRRKHTMPRYTTLICLLVFSVSGLVGLADDVSVTIDTDQVVNHIDEKVYGHFLEHIYHSCNGGLWGELIWDRSFEGGGAGIAWSVTDDCIAQDGAASDVRLVFGSPDWSDYEFTVEARKTGGSEGFLILLRSVNKREFYWANLGGWNNAGHALERGIKGGGHWGMVTRRKDGRIEEDHWYQIRARCEGQHIQVWLDDELVIDYTDDGKGPQRGQAGVGTWSTQAQFRNFKVTSLDGETLFTGLPPLPAGDESAAPGWHVAGSAQASTSNDNPLNGDKCKLVKTSNKAGGLVQRPMKISAGETYSGSLWARGTAKGDLQVRLLVSGNVIAQQTLPAPSEQWEQMPIHLEPTESSDYAALEILLPASATVWLDQVSLMPDSWRDSGGCRPDLLEAIADLQPPMIRWPGGCFASPYRWKDGIGPQHQRGPHPTTMWDDKEVNSFGTDEFIAMCRQVRAEPLIVVNIGTPEWNRGSLDNDFLQEVLDWIEYCNGPADSKWGQLRAANGHPEPYNVKYWEIDNETWHMSAETYAEWVNRFAPAMRQADPTIKLAACGSGGYGNGRNGLAWNRILIEQCADKIDYLSIHHYENPDNFAAGPRAYEAFFRKTGDLITASKNPDLKIYVSEWNAQSTDWRTGLYCGGLLNAFERCGDILEIGGPALFLRHVSASAWDNAFVNFDHRTWFPAPNYVVMKLWRENFLPLRVELDGEKGDLNIVASKSDDGATVCVKVVNPSQNAVATSMTLSSGAVEQATLQLVAPGKLDARNTLNDRHVVRPQHEAIRSNGGTITFRMPSYSAGVVRMSVRRE